MQQNHKNRHLNFTWTGLSEHNVNVRTRSVPRGLMCAVFVCVAPGASGTWCWRSLWSCRRSCSTSPQEATAFPSEEWPTSTSKSPRSKFRPTGGFHTPTEPRPELTASTDSVKHSEQHITTTFSDTANFLCPHSLIWLSEAMSCPTDAAGELLTGTITCRGSGPVSCWALLGFIGNMVQF